MASATSLLCLFFFLLSSSALAHDITVILNHHKEFSSFNHLLTVSGLAREINAQKAVTVLAVDNLESMALAGMPPAAVKKILSAHVLLGYYDLKHLATRSHEVILNSFFKGFDFTVDPSAYVKQVEVHPGRISVVQVAGVITPYEPPQVHRRKAAAVAPGASDEPVDDYDVEEAPTPGVGPSAALAPVTGEAATEAAGSVPPTSANATASSAPRAAVSLLGAALGGFIYQIVA